MIDHVATAMAETSSGMATPSYGFRGIQIAHGVIAVMALVRVNMPNLRFLGVSISAAD